MSLDSATLRTAIESISDLPTLPMVAAKIASMAGDPSTNAADIGRLIEQDQALTGKVLRLVNSAYYGFPRQIRSVQHAVVILGFQKVTSIVITASVFDIVTQSNSSDLDVRRLWQHSLGTAIASKVVAESLGAGHSATDAFIGGLLHDAGKTLLSHHQAAIYGPVIRGARDKGMLLVEAEKSALGLDHTEVGGWLVEKWRLPPIIVNMVRYHHMPARAGEARKMAAAVHLGDILARALGVGNGGDNRIPAIDPTIVGNYAVDANYLEKAIDKVIIDVGKANEFFALFAGRS